MKKIVAVVLIVVFVAGIVTAGVFLFRKKTNNPISQKNAQQAVEENVSTSAAQLEQTEENSNDEVLVQTDDDIQKIKTSTGETKTVSALENDDFSSFSGFPKLGNSEQENAEQDYVLVSQNKSQALVSVIIYDGSMVPNKTDGSLPVLRTENYLCKVSEKTCQQSNIFSQDYEGIDVAVKKNVMWSNWDSKSNLLFGHIVSGEGSDISPVYACNIETKKCDKTQQTNGDIFVVPQGSFDPLLDKFVMINQHDVVNTKTGKQWELFLYSSSDLAKPLQIFDISGAISQGEDFAYDSVYSVAWSQDEKLLAIATRRKIFMFDFETKNLSLVYTDPATEDDDLNLDSSVLRLSPDGKYIYFIDSASDEESETGDETVNVLKRIDLKDNNKVSEVTRGVGLSLK